MVVACCQCGRWTEGLLCPDCESVNLLNHLEQRVKELEKENKALSARACMHPLGVQRFRDGKPPMCPQCLQCPDYFRGCKGARASKDFEKCGTRDEE